MSTTVRGPVTNPNGVAIPEFEVTKRLPSIGGTEVFVARRLASGQLVLFRVLRPDLASQPILIARFLDAVSAARAVEHPHLAKVLDSGFTPQGRPWVSTEYFDGEDLAQHLRTHPGLSPAELIQLAVPMCEALAAAHKRGVLHGGIKPSSIFIARGLGHEASRLLDLGLSRFEGDVSVEGDRAGQVALLMYAAPETIGGGAPDVRSDLYSFGVVLYEALTGAPPFVASGPDELRRLQLEKKPRRLTGKNAPLADIVERCLAKNPIDRFTTARQLADALKSCRLPSTLDPLAAAPPLDSAGGAPDDDARERVGDLLGTYQLLRLIGVGSMGRVYLAQHTKLGRQVAVKVLRASQTKHKALVQRFFQEARSVNQINHEHIVEVFDFVEEVTSDGHTLVYCVMELLAGTSLSALLSVEHLRVERCVAMAQQVCSALGAAHQVGVVHRDIKPDNIFLTTKAGQGDYVKVLDFGVAKVLIQPGVKISVSDTASGALVGTPTYMSPEQAAGKPVDSRADIYAVGTVLYEMLTGHPPFQSTTFGQLAAEIITQDPPPIDNLSVGGENIPRGLKTEILTALEKDPNDRHPTMDALSAALAPYAAHAVVPVKRRRGVFVGLLLAGALVLAAGVRIGLGAIEPAPAPAPAERPTVIFQPLLPVAPAEQAPASITLTITSTPDGALVIRQDTRAALGVTPLTLAVPKLAAEIMLTLKLEGYREAERPVRLDADRAIDVALRKEKAPTRPPPVVGDKPKKEIGKESTIDPFSE